MANFDLTQKYEFSSSAKRWSIIMILLGIATVAFGKAFLTYENAS